MTNEPLISVITPSLNQRPFIRHAIEFVLAHGGEDWEHVVVDEGSSDETISILKEYSHLIWVSEHDQGQSDASNKAMKMSQGDVVSRINFDDVVAPGSFAVAKSFFANHPDARIICGNAVTFYQIGTETSRTGSRVPLPLGCRYQYPSAQYRFSPGRIRHSRPVQYLPVLGDGLQSLRARLRSVEDPPSPGWLRSLLRLRGKKTGGGAAEAFTKVRKSLVRYVRKEGDCSPTQTAFRMNFAEAYAWVHDAVALYLNGQPRPARHLLFGIFDASY